MGGKKPFSIAFLATGTPTFTLTPTITPTSTPVPTHTNTPDPCPIGAAQQFDSDIARLTKQVLIAAQNLMNTNKSTRTVARNTIVSIKRQIEETDHPPCADNALEKIVEQMDAVIELADALVANANSTTVTELANQAGKTSDMAVKAMDEFYKNAGINTHATEINVTPAKVTYTVKYVVSGLDTDGASIYLRNETGGTDTGDYYLPFSKVVTMVTGDFAYVSAQNLKRNGSVKCQIFVNNTMVKEATSNGAYAIATCDFGIR